MLKNTPYCRLLCASASAYYVQLDGHFVTPKPTDKDYKEFINVGFYRPPMAFSKPSTKTGKKINAAILGQTDFGMVEHFVVHCLPLLGLLQH